MTHIKYLLNCKKFISLMILFSFFDNFGMDTHGTKSKDLNKKLFSFDKEMNAKSLLCKVCFVGAGGVGKTNILSRIFSDFFKEEYLATIGLSYIWKYVKIDNQIIILQIWDIAGQGNFISIFKKFIEAAQIIVLVYSVTDKNSFAHFEDLLKKVKDANPNAEFLLVGNKIDLEEERKVKTEEGKEFAKNNGMEFFEVSAKEGTGCNKDFFDPFIIKLLRGKKLNEESLGLDNDNNSIGLKSSFCDECCSCCPCLKQSDDLDCVSNGN